MTLWWPFSRPQKKDLSLDLQTNEQKMKALDQDIDRLSKSKATLISNISSYLRSLFIIFAAILVFFESRFPIIHTDYINIRLDVFLLAIFGYFVILYGNLLIEYIYRRRIDNRKRKRTQLLKLQKQKLEELKKATKFNETQELVRKYENPQPRPIEISPSVTPKYQGSITTQSERPNSASTNFLDRVLDKIVGEEDFESKLALICKQCYSHNGLCPPDQYDSYMFKCRICSFLNMGPKAVSPIIHASSIHKHELSPNSGSRSQSLSPASPEVEHSNSESQESRKSNSAKISPSIDQFSVTSDQSN
eukprot:NODE_964_length_2867_cov_0.824422.p1 type:complete len:305 gc:universal NODE_964_length_2867_cov_0.824422:1155-241(-)